MKAKKPLSYWVAALSIGGLLFPYDRDGTYADEKGEKTQESSRIVPDRPNLAEAIMARYRLSDDQMQKMRDQGLDGAEIIKSAQLAESSKTPLSEILKMRLERSLSWGMISKDLGVEPGVADQAVTALVEKVNQKAKPQSVQRTPAVKKRR